MMVQLVPHPDTPPHRVGSVVAELIYDDRDDLLVRYTVDGASTLLLPEWLSPARADGLWKTTCFELFLKPAAGEAYYEFNFSPSSQWAAYAFDGYRQGMRDLVLSVDPFVEREPKPEAGEQFRGYVLDADIDFSGMPPGALRLGVSAVIEETDGAKSYWALAHPPGKPDFHHPDCFVLELPAANAA